MILRSQEKCPRGWWSSYDLKKLKIIKPIQNGLSPTICFK